MSTTIQSYQQVTRNLPASLERISRQPEVRRESERYLADITKVKSLDDFMANDRVFRYAMTAFGLEDMSYAKAFVRKILSEGIDRPTALANRLADPRYRELATAFNFNRYGSATTSFDRTQKGTVDRYVRQTLEVQAGQTNEGVRLALYFQRKAPEVASPIGLLADRALLKVTQIALGLPEATGTLDIDRQADLITRRLNVADLKDPTKLSNLLNRFAATWDTVNPSTAVRSPALDLIGGGNGGIGGDLIAQLQKRRSGR
jgi:Protein of unknown function (DUF1217)